MRKEAWIYSVTGVILGAFGVLLHWLQMQTIFPDDTGLPVQNAPMSWLMGLALAGIVALLWWLSGRLALEEAPPEPEDALVLPNKQAGFLLGLGAVLAAGGAVLLFFKNEDTLLRITSMLGLIAVPALLMYPSLPRWSGMGAFLSVTPVAFFCLWLVTFYKENAVNPVVWQYAMQILAISACLLGSFHLCAYLFYRAKPRWAAFSCNLAVVLCMTVLADDTSMAMKLLFLGWGIGLGMMNWIIVDNFGLVKPPEKPEKKEA